MIYNLLSIITMTLSLVLGIFVYFSDRAKFVNKLFLALIFSTTFWIFSNMMTDISTNVESILLWSKMTILGPVLFGFSFYKLSVVFPIEKRVRKSVDFINIIFVAVFLIFIPTRFNIESVYILENKIPAINPGPLYVFFLVYFVYIIAYSLSNLFKQYSLFDRFKKLQVQYISIGLRLSVLLGSITNLIFPIIGNSRFVNFGPYFVLIFVTFTAIAIIRFRLFDIKIITTQILVFMMWVVVLIRILLSDNVQDQLLDATLLTLLIIFGTFLIRSVIREINQREHIEKLAVDLKKANTRLLEIDKQKSEFVSLATHQLRAPLTAIKGYSSLIMEGEMGVIGDEVKNAVKRIFDSSKTLANVVDDYFNISRIELGTMKYTFTVLNLKEMVESVIAELGPTIDKSGLKFSFTTDPSDPKERFMVRADRDKLKQVITNLLDNSLKYTSKGSIEAHLSKNVSDIKIMFQIKDTGVGIAPEVMPKLFAKFVRAGDASKQNIYGTGLGLYVAKEIMSAHKGHVWAESDGEGKGSTFIVEIDMEV